MSPCFIGDLVIVLLITARTSVGLEKRDVVLLDDAVVANVSLRNINIKEAFTQRVTIGAESKVMFNITDIDTNVHFIIFQIHTYQYNVTLSYDDADFNKVSNRSVFGSNVGLYVKPSFNQTAKMYLKNDNVRVVEAVIAAVVYDDRAPTPGGCNMEFKTEISPYQKLLLRNSIVIVDVQPASVPSGRSVPDCQASLSKLKNEMYQIYLPEQDFSADTYFSSILTMLTVEDIVQNGWKVSHPAASSQMRRVFSAYTGMGSVYVSVTNYGEYSAAYVPSFSYACNPVLYPESCQILNGVFSKLFCAATFFIGCFSVFFGRRCFPCDKTVSTLFMGTVIFYTIIVGTIDFSGGSSIGLALLGGVFLLILVELLGACYPSITAYVRCLPLGWFLTCIMYFHAPHSFIITSNNFAFWLLFVVVTTTFMIFLRVLCDLGICMSSAIFGSLMVTLPIDYYLGSSLKYIVINFVRRTTEKDFGDANVIPPYQLKDVCLTTLWTILAVYRVLQECLPNIRVPLGKYDRPHVLSTNNEEYIAILHDAEVSDWNWNFV